MEPEIFCGASEGHVIFNNVELKEGEPIKIFGKDEINKEITWLDMKNCAGSIDSTTFSLLPELEYLNIAECNFTKCGSKTFGLFEKLSALDIRNSKFPLENHIFEGNKSIESLYLSDFNTINDNIFIYFKCLEILTFDNSYLENLNKTTFSGLIGLKNLTIANCKVLNIKLDTFEDLIDLEELNIRDNEIDIISNDTFLNLTNLKTMVFHNNKIGSEIVDYDLFKKLPKLENILFETHIYKNLEFDGFPNLKNVQIALFECSNSQVDVIVEILKSRNINYEFVFCGKLDESGENETH